jgi:rhamnose transport system permease protein
VRREVPAALALGALLAVVAIAAPTFFRGSNLADLALNNLPALIAAAGVTLVILAGHIDISIGSQFAICSVAAGLLARAGMPVIVAILGAAALGAGFGAINGTLVARAGIPSIVVTLASMIVLRDVLRWSTGGEWVRDIPATFQWMGMGQSRGGIVLAIAAAVVLIALAWALRNLAVGRRLYATGSNPEGARLVGIRTRAITAAAFVLCGGMTGLAAAMNSMRFAEVQGNAGVGLEMKAIAAVVVGGAAITGGRGTLLGTLIGVALLGVAGTALAYLGVNSAWERALQGAIILAAVASSGVIRKRRSHA